MSDRRFGMPFLPICRSGSSAGLLVSVDTPADQIDKVRARVECPSARVCAVRMGGTLDLISGQAFRARVEGLLEDAAQEVWTLVIARASAVHGPEAP